MIMETLFVNVGDDKMNKKGYAGAILIAIVVVVLFGILW